MREIGTAKLRFSSERWSLALKILNEMLLWLLTPSSGEVVPLFSSYPSFCFHLRQKSLII